MTATMSKSRCSKVPSMEKAPVKYKKTWTWNFSRKPSCCPPTASSTTCPTCSASSSPPTKKNNPMNLHDLENHLIEEWRTRSRRNGDTADIAPDGILYRGAFSYDEGYWTRLPGDECNAWERASRRILILTKDLNDAEAWDIRAETGRLNHSGPDNIRISAPFYKNLMRWVYGILHAAPGNPAPDFDDINRQEIYQPFYDNTPLARINCKKQLGGATLSNADLHTYLTRYRDLLTRQITAYDPHILLCCGSSNLIKDFIRETILPDLRQTNDWIYHSPATGTLLINSYHPSYRGAAHRDMYAGMMSALQQHLNRTPLWSNF